MWTLCNLAWKTFFFLRSLNGTLSVSSSFSSDDLGKSSAARTIHSDSGESSDGSIENLQKNRVRNYFDCTDECFSTMQNEVTRIFSSLTKHKKPFKGIDGSHNFIDDVDHITKSNASLSSLSGRLAMITISEIFFSAKTKKMKNFNSVSPKLTIKSFLHVLSNAD